MNQQADKELESFAQTVTRTVLFTDLVASTELRVRLGDDDADTLRRDHDRMLGEAISSHGGVVIKGLGDGILATFEAAADAAGAAISIQQAVDMHCRHNPDRPLGVRVGISLGDVSLESGDVYGVAVVEAARLCAAAAGGEILVADLIRSLSRGRGGFIFDPLGDLELRGLPDPVPACRLRWEPLPDDTSAAGVTGLPFPGLLDIGRIGYVGRADLRAHLAERRRAADAGGTAVVLLAGEPGVGKTRTAGEVARGAFLDGAMVLYGRCDEDLAAPYQPFAEAVDFYAAYLTGTVGITTQAAAAADHAHANADADAFHADADNSHAGNDQHLVLGHMPGELVRLVPHLAAHVPDLPPPLASDPRSEEHQLFEAVASWLVELARQQETVLVLDDLHWATRPTLLMLLHVLRAASAAGPSVHLLVLATYRDTDIDRRHPLSATMAELRRLPGVERVTIQGLSEMEVEAFIAKAAGHPLDDDDSQAMAHAVYAETEGNPFFVSEVLRHLVETGAVRRREDRWVVVSPASLSVPEGVRDVVGRRLSRLSPEANELLSLSSAIGREFEVSLLSTLTDLNDDALLDALDEAVLGRLVEETGADRYRFSHALVRATLYEEMSATRRRRLHRRVAEALEKLGSDDVVALSYHFIEAGPDADEMARALRYVLAAGEQALGARALGDAENRFRQALEVMEDAGDDHTAARIGALCGLGESQRDQGDSGFRATLLEASRLALALLRDGSDGSRPSAASPESALALLVRAVLANSRGMSSVVGNVDEERIAYVEAALDAVGPEPGANRARLLALLAGEVAFAGDHARRLALVEEAEAMARQLGADDLLAWVLVRTGFAAIRTDRAHWLVERSVEAAGLADATGDPALRVLARLWWSSALMTLGDMEGMRRITEEMVEISDDASPTLRWTALAFSIRVLHNEGRLDEARQRNDECARMGEALGEPDAWMWWGALAIAEGRLRGQVAATPEQVAEYAEQFAGLPTWKLGQVQSLAYAGRVDEARQLLAQIELTPEGLLDEPFPIWGPAQFAEAAHTLRDGDMAARCARALEPYRGMWSNYLLGVAAPVESHLGICRMLAGEHDEAVARLEDALSMIEAQAPGLLPIGCLNLGEALLARNSPGDRTRALEVIARARDVALRLGAPGYVEGADLLLAMATPSADDAAAPPA